MITKRFTIIILRPIIFAVLILANIYLIKSAGLGVILGGIFLLHYGSRLGSLIFPQFDRVFQTVYGSLAVVGLNSIILWIGFYLYQINLAVFFVSILATSLATEYFGKATAIRFLTKKLFASLRIFVFEIKPKLLILGYFISIALSFRLLVLARTAAAIASPWNLLPKTFFLFFLLASALLIIIILKNQCSWFSLALISIHTFLIASVGLIVYKIGYGYDPFLHLAAIKEIISHGIILPKTFYYIGEYSIIIFLHDLTQVSVSFLNKALLPVGFAIFFPCSVYYGLTKGLKLEERFALTASLAGLFLPLTYFIATTPQGLTNLLCLIVIFLSLISAKDLSIYFLLFLALLAITIHPLFGLPILLFVLFLWFRSMEQRRLIRRIGQALTILSGLVIFPALFFFNSAINYFKISLQTPRWGDFLPEHFIGANKQFNLIGDLIFAYGFNVKLIFLLIIAAGVLLLLLQKKIKPYFVYLAGSLILLVNFLLTKSVINFEFSTNQNRGQYLHRISEIGLYFLLPIFIFVFYSFIKYAVDNKRFASKAFFIFILSLALFLSLFFSYPIKDSYKDSQEYNVTAADIEAAHFIAAKAKDEFVVLGNQMLAAAAIKEFGFKHYYKNNFYYSIPRAGTDSLYQYYEKMVFIEPTIDSVRDAMNLAGVNSLYFVVSDYWTNSKDIIAKSKKIANDWFVTAGGANHIFYFEK